MTISHIMSLSHVCYSILCCSAIMMHRSSEYQMKTKRGEYVMQEPKSHTASNETNLKRKGPSKMAEGIALQRVDESNKSEEERIFYDPYAIYFVNPVILEFAAKNPEQAKAALEQMERFLPGHANSIRARVRYFDDFIRTSINEGLEQLVILGAGYDTRAYRIEDLKGKVIIFEVDHPDTQCVKVEKIKKIFGSIPNNVTFVSIDFETETLSQKLFNSGYERSKKTLFVMEGLIMYLPPEAVERTLSFISRNSSKGSSIIFDYYPESVIDGTSELEVGKNIMDFVAQLGEPLKFGIEEGTVGAFLTERGFSSVQNVTAEKYKKMYFHGINKDREVCDLLSFAHAVIE
jgi:methyltransferase (TIGR00027 family)